MVSQKIPGLDGISYVVANSLARKLAGVGYSAPIQVFKIGITSKGQPWIYYSVNGKKCSQFVSKKLWDLATKKQLYSAYQVVTCADNRLVLGFTIFSSSGSNYCGNFSGNLKTLTSEVACDCEGFKYRKSCCHSSLIQFVGSQIMQGVSVGKLLLKSNCFVVSAPSSLTQPVTQPVTPPATQSTEKTENLSDRIWRDREKISLWYYGKQYSAVRVSLVEKEIIEAENSLAYQIVETSMGNCLIEVQRHTSDGKVPMAIAAAHAQAKSRSQAELQKAYKAHHAEIPDIFGKIESLNIEWNKSNGNLWKSSQGDEVDGEFLKEVVRRQLLVGHNIFIRTSKNLYKCNISASGDVENIQISMR